MKQRITRTAAIAGATLLLGACSSVNLDVLSFGGAKEQDTSRAPAGATAYQCDANKRLLVRYLDNGAAAWVMLPDREFRLNKATSGGANRYSNGSTTLEINDAGATLSDGAAVTHAGCKASGG
ncbi:MAG: MliC family protein [Betaproteobacteria bacterium]|nr:MliC family protein [Betaproteobacteria bacterium]